MLRNRYLQLFAGTVLLLGSAVSARADFFFNFNSLAPSAGDNSAAIATYMEGVLCPVAKNCVTVVGAATDRTYNGEGEVVGPGGVSRTLGNSDGATNNSSPATPTSTTYDTFLANTTDGSSQISQEIKIIFSHGIVLNGALSFDFEIFPDMSCPNKNNCPATPDFKFAVNGGAPMFTQNGFFPANPGSNGNSTQSPKFNPEPAAQFIGTWSGNISNATELDFIDWPATIGVDNLKYTTPEPTGGVFFLAGLALAGLAGTRLRRALAKS